MLTDQKQAIPSSPRMGPEAIAFNALADLLERGWTQGCSAKDRRGNWVSHGDPQATSFDIVGGMWRVCRSVPKAEEVLGLLVAHLHLRSIACLYDWNDAPGRTAGEVISTLRRVATLSESGSLADSRRLGR